MVITTYSFSKDKKSTKRPSSGGTTYNIVLKENTSVDNPTFILTHDGVPTFDYCQWIFGYYFVEDVKLQSKDVYEINCKLDVLATYRDDILNSTQFVLRSASDYNIFLKDDEMKPALNQIKTVYDTNIDVLSGSSYLLRIMGKSTATSRYGIPTYIVSSNTINNIVYKIFNNQVFTDGIAGIPELGELLKCLFFNPSSYIISINWLPVNIQGGATSDIYSGWYNTNETASVLDTDGIISLYSINTPSAVFNDFRDFDENYTKFELSLPCVGVVPINPADAYAGINVNVSVEYLTGTLIYYLYNAQTNAIIAKYKTNINCSIQIGGINNSINGSSLTSVIGSAITDMTSPNYNVIGNVGSRMEIENDHTFRLTRRIYGSSEYGTPRVGRPLRAMRTLTNLSGYCKCEDVKLDTTAYGLIKDEILNYMEEGFFIE